MKKTLLILSIMFLITFNGNVIAQVSNGSFENWESPIIKLTRAEREALVIGNYIPNESNTGLLPGWTPNTLEQVVPPISTQRFINLSPGVYENKIFWGEVRIPNNGTGGVIFRNCFFAGCDPEKIPDGTRDGVTYQYYGETFGLLCDANNIAQWQMYDCKVDPSAWFDASLNPPGGARTGNMSFKLRSVAGVRGGSGTMRRCEITNSSDGISVVQWTKDESDPSFFLLEGNWIHKMIFYKGDGHHQPEGTHSDVIQFHVGRNITIRGNRLGGVVDSYGYNSNPSYNSGDDASNAIIMLRQVDNLPINKLQNILIEKNLFEGGFYNINHAAGLDNYFETTQIKDNWFIQRTPTYYVIRPTAFSSCYSNNRIATWNVKGVSINILSTINYNNGTAPTY